MYRHLCYSQLCYYFDFTDSTGIDKVSLAQELIERYRDGLKFGKFSFLFKYINVF